MHVSESDNKCPSCARAIPATAPRGLCPACLVGLLLAPIAEPDVDDGPPPAPAVPAERLGPYELLDVLGRGGMGVVFRARDTRLNRLVALKLILTGRLASDAEVKRFRTEAEAAAQLEHPNIVPIYEVGETEGRHFFVMKLVEGGTLSQRIADGREGRSERVSLSVAANLVARVARAVHHAHQRGILHRDLKPGNILIEPDGSPVVSDFGLARRLQDDSQLTLSATVLGSPAYMAPEQARGRAGEVTTSADIYSLGAVLYELLADRPPFVGSTPLDTLQRALEQEPIPPTQARPKSSHRPGARIRRAERDLEIICLKCLEKNPARRYASAAALADDLESWARGEPILARSSGRAERLWKWARRHPAGAALAVVSAVGLGGFLILQRANEDRLTEERNRARHQEAVARESERVTRLNLYAADMYLASRALDQGNLALARRTLAAHIPRPGAEDLRGFEWRYYWQRARGQQERVLTGFSQPVNSVAFSPDGRWLAAGGGNLVRKWATSNFVAVSTFQHEPRLEVCSVVFSPDGSMIGAGESRGQLRVWVDGLTRPIGEITRGTGAIHIVAPAVPTGTIAIGELIGSEGGARGSVAVYGFLDLLGRNEKGTILYRNGGLASFSHDGQWLLTGGGGQTVVRHNLKTGESKPIPGWNGLLEALALSPDGRRAVTAPSSGTSLHLYDFGEDPPLSVTVTLDWRCRALAFSPDGTTVAGAGYDHTVRLLHGTDGRTWHRFDGHTDQVFDVVFSPDGRSLASASKDGTVRIWDLSQVRRDEIRGVFPPFALSPDSRTMVAGTMDDWSSTVVQRDLTKPAQAGETELRLRADRFPGLNHQNNGLVRWRAFGGATPEQWAKMERFVGRDTNRVTWLSRSGGAGSDRVAASIRGVSAASADGSVMAMADHRVRLWHNPSSRRLPELSAPEPRGVRQLALSDDGALLAVGTSSNVVTLWRTSSGSNLWKFPVAPRPVNELLFSPNSRILALAGDDATIQLHDIADFSRTNPPAGFVPVARVLAVLTGHEVGVRTLAFSPDGRTLATAGGDWLKLWHLPTLREVGSLRMGGDHLAFAPDGSMLLMLWWNGTSKLLRAPNASDAGESIPN